MTRDEIVYMLAAVDFQFFGEQDWDIFDKYEAFAKLVAEKERAPQRTWVGLTEEELTEIRQKTFDSVATNHEVYRVIEAKLKEKNI